MSALPYIVEDCLGAIKLFSDGSIIRSPDPSPAAPTIDPSDPVLWKDVRYDHIHGLDLRLYKPRNPIKSNLPILLYFHGGGFCLGSRTLSFFHDFCLRIASELGLLVVAPDYRLAPEHRLPAAVDDAFSAFEWIRSQAALPYPDPFLVDVADFNYIFVSGDSAGGNLVHQFAIRFQPAKPNPVRVGGYILICPFFGGTQRTQSERECPKEENLNLDLSDQFWKLCLPLGASRDHPLSNPISPASPGLEDIAAVPMLVAVGGTDVLRDRELDYAERLKGFEKAVEVKVFDGQPHDFFLVDSQSDAAGEFVRDTGRFIKANVAGP